MISIVYLKAQFTVYRPARTTRSLGKCTLQKQVCPLKVRALVTNGVRNTLDRRLEVVGDPVGLSRRMDAEGKLGTNFGVPEDPKYRVLGLGIIRMT